MNKLSQAIWPRPERLSSAEISTIQQEGRESDARILSLQGISDTEASLYLEAARHIADYEDKRKAGAETRATTFIAAVAALIPLMTWAISNTGPSLTCSQGWGCSAWTCVFFLAVIYFITAAYWALKTLAVANYHVIGVEDVVHCKEEQKNLYKVLIQQTLLQARRNRETINQKLTFIKVAQRRFFNGLAVLGLLLMLDPVSRFGLWETARGQLSTWVDKPNEMSVSRLGDSQPGTAPAQRSEVPELFLQVSRQLPSKLQQQP